MRFFHLLVFVRGSTTIVGAVAVVVARDVIVPPTP